MSTYRIGMVGLGVMGRNLLLNISTHGFPVAGFDISPEQTASLIAGAQGREVFATSDLAAFIGALEAPRSIIILVPPGKPVDSVLEQLRPRLGAGDLVIDSGNSHFSDTERRIADTTGAFTFTGMGISGGEQGARHGASMMFGGTRELYARVEPMLAAVAATVDGSPCVARVGERSAGHYVKMVHNGIEYGVMELIAECYDLMRRGLGLTAAEIADVFDGWNRAETASYLVEITAIVLRQPDARTGAPLADMILDQARQKGTGRWTSQEAMRHGVPLGTIDAAVGARDLSAYREQRLEAAQIIGGPDARIEVDRAEFLKSLREAFYDTMVIIYAQGMSLLTVASREYNYDLDLAAIARIWRGGCIIRAALLERIGAIYRSSTDIVNPLIAPELLSEVASNQSDLRSVVATAARAGLPVPTMMAALSYFDAYRSQRLPANLIQAQRDYFGAHTYERIDEAGTFHTDWAGPATAGSTPSKHGD
ncbi:MAG TPA: NADP-dependent phosphogluconate dehydrogenase [Candidatus Kapabacteria bacterium]|nr:NADP-dependent phosphogluconate dehydrogenase [Candidatus Kapabacteria bacterium]